MAHRAKLEEKSIGDALSDADRQPPMLARIAALDALYQDANPVRIVTSGLERMAECALFRKRPMAHGGPLSLVG